MAKNDNLGDFLKSTADKLRSKLGITDAINPQDFEDKVDEVYNKGKQEEYNTFWDSFQRNGERESYEYAFAYGWTNESFKPKYNIRAPYGSHGNMFSYSGITGSLKQILNDLGITLSFYQKNGRHSGATYVFVNTKFTELPVIDFSEAEGNTALQSAFVNNNLLETIEKVILPVNCTAYGANTFQANYALKNINFEGTIKYSLDFKDCPLSADSMKNIFDHLDTNPTPDLRTITIKQVVKDNYIAKYGETEWNNNIALYTGVLPGWSFTLV